MSDEYRVKLSDHEMFLILTALAQKVDRATPERAPEYKSLHDRLELIYEDRV